MQFVYKMMARSGEITNGVVRLQALVRGYIVRQQFRKVREEYAELVISFEEDNFIKVTWRLKDKPCIPSISHGFLKRKTKCESVPDDVGKQDQKIDTCFECDDVSVLTCQSITQSTNSVTTVIGTENENGEYEGDCVPEKALEVNQSIRELPNNNLDLLGKCQTDNHALGTVENDGCPYVDCCEDHKPDLQETIVKSKEIKNKDFQELGMRGIQGMFGVPLNTYPKNTTELLKLREDLAMELLWIQQAIESRKTYLITKKHLEE